DDVEHEREPDPELRELDVVALAHEYERDTEDRDRVDHVLRDARHEEVRLDDRPAGRTLPLLRLRRVDAVQYHRPDTHDHREDVEEDDELVGATVGTNECEHGANSSTTPGANGGCASQCAP